MVNSPSQLSAEMYHKPKLHDVTYMQGRTQEKEQKAEPASKLSSRLIPDAKTVGHVHVGGGGTPHRSVDTRAPKKRSKFVPVTSPEDISYMSVRLPGQHICDCQAQQHALVNNCISCGRVVCEQEGAGPCTFCGTLVCSPADWEVIKSNTNKGKKLLEKLMKGQGHTSTGLSVSLLTFTVFYVCLIGHLLQLELVAVYTFEI